MTRPIEQILADQKIEISPRLIRTPEVTISVGNGWIISQYDWQGFRSTYLDGPSAVAVAMLVASIWILASPIPPDMPWLIPAGFAVAIGATWSIGRWAWNRWMSPEVPERPSKGLTFSYGLEGSVTLFESNDDQEIQLLRQKLEQSLLQRKNGDDNGYRR